MKRRARLLGRRDMTATNNISTCSTLSRAYRARYCCRSHANAQQARARRSASAGGAKVAERRLGARRVERRLDLVVAEDAVPADRAAASAVARRTPNASTASRPARRHRSIMSSQVAMSRAARRSSPRGRNASGVYRRASVHRLERWARARGAPCTRRRLAVPRMLLETSTQRSERTA